MWGRLEGFSVGRRPLPPHFCRQRYHYSVHSHFLLPQVRAYLRVVWCETAPVDSCTDASLRFRWDFLPCAVMNQCQPACRWLFPDHLIFGTCFPFILIDGSQALKFPFAMHHSLFASYRLVHFGSCSSTRALACDQCLHARRALQISSMHPPEVSVNYDANSYTRRPFWDPSLFHL